MAKKSPPKKHRSAVTGRYVTENYAKNILRPPWQKHQKRRNQNSICCLQQP